MKIRSRVVSLMPNELKTWSVAEAKHGEISSEQLKTSVEVIATF